MSTTTPSSHSRPASRLSPQVIPWLAPVAVVVVWKLEPGRYFDLVDTAVTAIIAVTVMLLASRRPNACLIALFAFMPYQVFVPAWLYAQGVPVGIIRPLTGWREVLGLAIALSAVREARRSGRRLDGIDALGFAYVTVVAAYALVPTLFARDAPIDTSVRSLGFRSSAGFVLLLLACRHAPFTERGRERIEQALRWTTVVVASMAIWEFVAGDSWNQFVVETLQVPRYQIRVLKAPVFNPADVRVFVEVGGREFVRVSSVMGSPLILSHFLLVPFGLALERALRGRTRGATLQVVLFGAAIMLTQTRSAMLSAALIVAMVMRRAPGRSDAARTRFWLVLVGLLVASTPFILSANLLDRFGEDTSSTAAHQNGFVDGIQAIGDHPLGQGLGTSAGVGQRFGTYTTVSENYYLQVGSEVGIIGAIAFGAVVITVNRRLRRLRDETGHALVAGVRSGFFGISLAAFFLHAYTDQTVAWVAFGAAGLALGVQHVGDARHPDETNGATMEDDQETVAHGRRTTGLI